MQWFQHVVSLSGGGLQWPFLCYFVYFPNWITPIFFLFYRFSLAFLPYFNSSTFSTFQSTFRITKYEAHFMVFSDTELNYLFEHLFKNAVPFCNSIVTTNRIICLACSPFRMIIITMETNWKGISPSRYWFVRSFACLRNFPFQLLTRWNNILNFGFSLVCGENLNSKIIEWHEKEKSHETKSNGTLQNEWEKEQTQIS